MSKTTPDPTIVPRRARDLAADPPRRRWRSWRPIAGVMLAPAVTFVVLAAIDIAAGRVDVSDVGDRADRGGENGHGPDDDKRVTCNGEETASHV